LFEACLGGLGQFGVIVAATLRLVAAPRTVRVRHFPYPDLQTFLAGQLALTKAGLFDYLVGNFVPPDPIASAPRWRYLLESVEYLGANTSSDMADVVASSGARLEDAAEPFEVDYLAYVNRLQSLVREWTKSGAWLARHPWLDLFVPKSSAVTVIEAALEGLAERDLIDGYVMTYPLRRSCLTTPMPGLPPSEEWLLFDVLPSVAHDRPHRQERADDRCRRVLEIAAALGAAVYPIGFPLGTDLERLWARQLHAHRDALRNTRARYDPDGVLKIALPHDFFARCSAS
jgi:FAD/FMN-containing dehydrogenase